MNKYKQTKNASVNMDASGERGSSYDCEMYKINVIFLKLRLK